MSTRRDRELEISRAIEVGNAELAAENASASNGAGANNGDPVDSVPVAPIDLSQLRTYEWVMRIENPATPGLVVTLRITRRGSVTPQRALAIANQVAATRFIIGAPINIEKMCDDLLDIDPGINSVEIATPGGGVSARRGAAD